ncbi:MAG: phospholipase D family protein [Pseudomonadota bacterium]|nr:phospholipase D family protein [Pseudomonadota bacterium]
MIDVLRLFGIFGSTYRAYAWLVVSSLASAAAFSWARATALLVAVALGGCAVLPSPVDRPMSFARTDVADTTLGHIASFSTPEGARDLSGFRLLPDGEEAFRTRVALVRRAEKTLDVQYYLIASDPTGFEFLRELRDAAARGVHVRIIVDDLYATGQDPLYASLAAHENVEVRVFNPLAVRGGSFATRVALSLREFSRINHRMHNKLFIADNTFAVTGGRNIADEYFDRSGVANFVDMDVLSSGPVVRQLSAVFDSFWNSALAYAIGELSKADAPLADRLLDGAAPRRATPVSAHSHGQDVVAQLEGGTLTQHFAAATVVADSPEKAEGAAALTADQDDDDADGVVMAAHTSLIRSAQSEVLVTSPYFIPGPAGLAAMTSSLARGVHVSVITNSSATTDEPIVHFAYARLRQALIRTGIDLRELSPVHDGHDEEEVRGRPGASAGSLGRLHAKVAVADGRRVLIGSMNDDRRSARWNTECVVLIESIPLASEVRDVLTRELLAASYQLRLIEPGGRIEWIDESTQAPSKTAAKTHVNWAGAAAYGLVLQVMGTSSL